MLEYLHKTFVDRNKRKLRSFKEVNNIRLYLVQELASGKMIRLENVRYRRSMGDSLFVYVPTCLEEHELVVGFTYDMKQRRYRNNGYFIAMEIKGDV